MIIENGIKAIRMGKKLNFIKGVILSDGTILENMQCELNAKIPNDKQLERFDRMNRKNFKSCYEREK